MTTTIAPNSSGTIGIDDGSTTTVTVTSGTGVIVGGSGTLSTAGNVVFSGNNVPGNGSAIYVNTGGIINISNGTVAFYDNTAGGSLGGGAIYATGSLVVHSDLAAVIIQGGSASNGGAARSASAMLWDGTYENLIINSNTAGTAGGGFHLGGLLTIVSTHTGSLAFSNNYAGGGHGGAIYSASGVDIQGNYDAILFESNTATAGGATAASGGAIYANAGNVRIETVTTSTVAFTGNYAKSNGGAIMANSGSIFLNGIYGNLLVRDNQANGSNGGALYAAKDIVINGTTSGSLMVTSNTAGSNGGAIYSGGNVFIDGTNAGATFQNNYASTAGGAIYVTTGGTISFAGNYGGGGILIDSNTAANSIGGAFYASKDILINGTSTGSLALKNNYAKGSGGALNAVNNITLSGTYASITIDHNTTGTNTAGNPGGALYAGWNIFVSTTTSGMLAVTNNTSGTAANSNGGAFYSGSNITIDGNYSGLLIQSNTAGNGSGGAFYSGGSINVSATTKGTLSLSDNYAKTAGGAFHANTGSIAITGSYGNLVIQSNTASTSTGGALNATNASNGVITIAGNYGPGGILIDSNTAGTNGGAFNAAKNILISATTDGALAITNNNSGTATTSVGGAFYSSGGTIGISGSYASITFGTNTAGGNGGALNANKDIVIDAALAGSLFVDSNTSTGGSGGALYASGNIDISPLTSGSLVFTNNYAKTNGGAIYSGGTIAVTGSYGALKIESNVSTGQGGAFYAGKDIILDGYFGKISIVSNTAATTTSGQGSGLRAAGGSIRINSDAGGDLLVRGNRVGPLTGNNSVQGGALLASGSVKITGSYNTFELSHNVGGRGAGIAAAAGDVIIDGIFGDILLVSNTSNWNDATTNETQTTKGGGGAILANGSVVIRNTTSAPSDLIIRDNYAGVDGGAIHATTAVSILGNYHNIIMESNAIGGGMGGVIRTMKGGIFMDTVTSGTWIARSNTAAQWGGVFDAAFVVSSSISVSGHYGSIILNDNVAGASDKGSGAVFGAMGDIRIDANVDGLLEISRNTSWSSGGAIFVYNAANSIYFTGTYGSMSIAQNSVRYTAKTVVADSEGSAGGAIYANGSLYFDPLVAGDITFNKNSARFGGALAAGKEIVIGGTSRSLVFDENVSSVAGGQGGAINAGGGRGVIISATTGALQFTKNRSASDGGAINSAKDVMIGGQYGSMLIQSNSSGVNGGAIDAVGIIIIDGEYGDVLIASNTANTGGALYGKDIRLDADMTNGGVFAIRDNRAMTTHGGAVYATGTFTMNVRQDDTALIASNTAAAANAKGGAIYSASTFNLSLADGAIFTATDNKASSDANGGFLWTNSGSMLFNIANAATATIGNANSVGNSTDSIGAANNVHLYKTGQGALILWGNNTYTGTTFIQEGKLLVGGYQSASTAQTIVQAGALLGGTGTIAGKTTILDGGTLAPGFSAGPITFQNSLLLNQNSVLAYDFGQANTAGGPLNDLTGLTLTTGTLVLDGKIDVTQSAGGNLTAGWYRVFDYSGKLSNNGLELGSLPASLTGYSYYVQTSIPTQVNLVLFENGSVNYWDGTPTATSRNNNIIEGGSGTWQAWNSSGTYDNWTNSTGAYNSPWQDYAHAMFTAIGGTVTVDKSQGDITASGMTFNVGGYLVQSGSVVLGGTNNAIFNISSTTGATISATIASTLTGTAGITKTGTDTLVLTGSNTYQGATTLAAGTLVSTTSAANPNAAATLSTGTIFYTNTTVGQGSTLFFANSATLANRQIVAVNAYGTLVAAPGTNLTVSATQNQTDGRAVYVNSSGTFNANGNITFISNTTSSTGGAIYVADGGALNFTGGAITFDSNRATGVSVAFGGGAIYAPGALVINGAGADALVFRNNSALAGTSPDGQGGAIYAGQGVMLSDTTHTLSFVDNTASVGGAIRAAGLTGGITMNGGVLLDRNIATTTDINFGAGGALSTNAGDIKVGVLAGNVTITRNISVGSSGGALEAGLTGNVVVGNANGEVDIQRNYAGYNYDVNRAPTIPAANVAVGGAIYSGGNTTLQGAHIILSDNHANGGGGGIYAQQNVTINGAITSSGNSSVTGDGGAIYAGRKITITAATTGTLALTNNIANGKGGAFYSGNSFLLTLSSGTLTATNNIAGAGDAANGGFLWVNTGSMLFNIGNNALATIGARHAANTAADTIAAATGVRLVKDGNGVLILNTQNHYAALTDIRAGQLVMTNTQALGATGYTVNIAASSTLTVNTGSIAFAYNLNGPAAGLFDVQLDNAADVFRFSQNNNTQSTAFAGTAQFRNATYTLTNQDFTNATVVTSTGNLFIVDTGSNHVGNFVYNTGTTKFDLNGNAAYPGRAGGWIDTGTLDFGVSGVLSTVQVDSNLISGGTLGTIPLIQQDDGAVGTQLIRAQTLAGDIDNLRLVDLTGTAISGTIANAIVQNTATTATGFYTVGGLSGTGAFGNGLYLATQLYHLDLIASTTTTLASDTVPPTGGDDFKAQITGSGNLAINATNVIALKSGSNTYTGTTFVNTGTLLGGNTDIIASSTQLVIAANAVFATGSYAQLVNNLAGSGTVVAASTLTLANNENSAYAGAITGTAAITKNGSATLELAGNSTYTGTVTIASGGLDLLGNIDGNILNQAVLIGTGTIGGDVRITTTGTLAAGDTTTAGKLTVGSLTLDAASRTLFDIATPGTWGGANDWIASTGSMNIGSGANLILNNLSGNATLQTGTADIYNLATYNSASGLIYGGFVIDWGNTGLTNATTYVDISQTGTIRLVNTGTTDNQNPDDPNAFSYWDGAANTNKFNSLVDGGSGNWQAWGSSSTNQGNNNWTRQSGDLNAPWKDAGYAVFSGSKGTVTIDDSKGGVTASGLRFTTDGYLLTGTTLNLVATTGTNTTIIETGTGAQTAISATIATVLAGNTNLTKLGQGTLELAAANLYTGITFVNEGKLRLTGSAISGAEVAANATLAGTGTFGGAVNVTGTIAAGDLGTTGKLTVGSLNLAPNSAAHFDLRATESPVTGTTFSGVNDWLASNGTLTAANTTLAITGTGALDIGLYHLMSYSDTTSYAALQNTVWNLAADAITGVTAADLYVQTTILNQINLINTGTTPNNKPGDTSLAFIWWDGDRNATGSNHNDSVVQGGNGIWEAWTGGNDNWTQQSGSHNVAWKQNGYAQFSGASGTVTVSSAKGQVIASGMNFLTDGYLITGGSGENIQLGLTTRGVALLSATSGVTGTIALELTDPTGTIALAKDGFGTVILTSTNHYAGGTHIEQGTLELATALATSSTIAIGSGTLTIDALAIARVSPGTVNTYTFGNALSGQGLLDIDLGTPSGTFAFNVVRTGTDFAGLVRLANATYDIAPGTDNTTALSHSTLITTSGAILNLGINTTSGTQRVHGIAFDGGTVNIKMQNANTAHAIEVDDLYVDLTGHNTLTHATVFDLGINQITTGTNVSGNFLDQDDGSDGIQLVKAATVDYAGKQMVLLLNGAAPVITSATISDNHGHTDVVATYNYMAVSSTDNHLGDGPGVYAAYVLTQLETNSGLVLTSSGANNLTLGARVTGTGHVDFAAANGPITLVSGSNDYTGATLITSGTVIAAAHHVLGTTSTLTLNPAAAFDLASHSQTIGVLNGFAGSALDLGASGSLAILNGGTSNGALIGGALSTLDIGGHLYVNGSNSLASTVNVTGTATLNDAAALGITGTLNDTGLVRFASTTGTLNKTVAGNGVVEITDGSVLSITSTNAFSGTWAIVDAISSLAVTSTANLGSADIANSGTFTIANTATEFLTNILSGTGAFIKTASGTLTIDRANTAYTGSASVLDGILRLENLLGTGTGNILNQALLDLAATGTYTNNISGSGTTFVNADGINITGSNSTVWNITAAGSGTVTQQQNLGEDATHIDGRLDIVSTGSWTYANTLTGTGNLSVDTSGNAFNFANTSGTAFDGTVILASSTFALAGDNTAALTNATLQLDAGNHTSVGSGTQQIGDLVLNGGRLDFDATIPADVSSAALVKTGTLAITSGTVGINLPALDVNTTADQLPLLQQDEGHGVQLIASATTIGNPNTGLQLVDIATGTQITNPQTANINQSGTTVATGTYDYGLAGTGSNGSGLYASYQLKSVDILANRTLALDQDLTVPTGGDDFTAKIGGSGNLAINATGVITLKAENTYTGTTFVNSGTLVSGVNDALGNTTYLYVSSAAAFNLNGKTQTIANGGLVLGTNGLQGTGTLNVTAGLFDVRNANQSLSALVNVATGTVQLAHVQGLGDTSTIALNNATATLVLAPTVSGTFATNITGSGLFVKDGGATVTIDHANNYTGAALVRTGTLSATHLAALGTADVTINNAATFEYRNIASGTSATTFSGSGALAIVSSTLAISSSNSMAAANLSNAVVVMANNNALGNASTTVMLANVNSAIWIAQAAPAAQLGTLRMNGGLLGFVEPANFATAPASAYQRLSIANLDASNATFVVNVNFEGAAGLMTPATGMKANSINIVNDAATAAAHLVRVNYTGTPGTQSTSFELITTGNGSAKFALDTTTGKIDFGVTAYELRQGDSTEFMPNAKNWYLADAGLAQAVEVMLDVASTIPLDWNIAMDALYLRMGDLRAENLLDSSTRDTEKHLTGNVWTRGRGYRINATNSVTGHDFDEYGWGITAGADKAFDAKSGVNFLGGFIDMGNINRDFDIRGTSDTQNVGVGAYLTLLRREGWFADIVARADRYSSDIEGKTPQNLVVKGEYATYSIGGSIEVGRRLQRRDGWWLEPTLQVSTLWLNGADYYTTPTQLRIHVTVDDIYSAQYRALVRFGRQIGNSRWQPYGKIGAVAVDSNSSTFRANEKVLSPTFDGKRVEFGFGTSYRIDALSQWYVDYEYAKANYYERPWSLNLGYRRLW